MIGTRAGSRNRFFIILNQCGPKSQLVSLPSVIAPSLLGTTEQQHSVLPEVLRLVLPVSNTAWRLRNVLVFRKVLFPTDSYCGISYGMDLCWQVYPDSMSSA